MGHDGVGTEEICGVGDDVNVVPLKTATLHSATRAIDFMWLLLLLRSKNRALESVRHRRQSWHLRRGRLQQRIEITSVLIAKAVSRNKGSDQKLMDNS
jgi:hypothetical protein